MIGGAWFIGDYSLTVGFEEVGILPSRPRPAKRSPGRPFWWISAGDFQIPEALYWIDLTAVGANAAAPNSGPSAGPSSCGDDDPGPGADSVLVSTLATVPTVTCTMGATPDGEGNLPLHVSASSPAPTLSTGASSRRSAADDLRRRALRRCPYAEGSPAAIPAEYLSGARSAAEPYGAAAAVWTAIIILAGSMSPTRSSAISSSKREEGAARIAELALRPETGTTLDLASWTGRSLTVDLAELATGTVRYPMRLFTGWSTRRSWIWNPGWFACAPPTTQGRDRRADAVRKSRP